EVVIRTRTRDHEFQPRHQSRNLSSAVEVIVAGHKTNREIAAPGRRRHPGIGPRTGYPRRHPVLGEVAMEPLPELEAQLLCLRQRSATSPLDRFDPIIWSYDDVEPRRGKRLPDAPQLDLNAEEVRGV